jgi:hypothetical protein
MEKIDSVALELIPFCAKLLKKSDAKVLVGDDVACLPHNPSHPTYSIETLRNLFISYLYLFKWVKWDPYLFPHGTLSSDVLGSVGRLIPGLPMVMDVGYLCGDILAHHPLLAGNRVHAQVHPSFIDRSLSSVLWFRINLQVTHHLHSLSDPRVESTYYESRKLVVRKDGLSEESSVVVLLRIFLSNMTRLWMVAREDWKGLASVCLEFLRSEYSMLVGGFAGLVMGDFASLLLVFYYH